MNLTPFCFKISHAFFTLSLDPTDFPLASSTYIDFLQKLTLFHSEALFFIPLLDQFLDPFIQECVGNQRDRARSARGWTTFSDISTNLLQANLDHHTIQSSLTLRSRFLHRINVFLFVTTQYTEILDMVPPGFFLDQLLSEEQSVNELLNNNQSASRIKMTFLALIKSAAVHSLDVSAPSFSFFQTPQNLSSLSESRIGELLEKFWSLILLPSFHNINNDIDPSLWISCYLDPILSLFSPVTTLAFFSDRVNNMTERTHKLEIFTHHILSIFQIILESPQYCHGREDCPIWPDLKVIFLQKLFQNTIFNQLFQLGFPLILAKHTELQSLKRLESRLIGPFKPTLYKTLIPALVERFFLLELSKADREISFITQIPQSLADHIRDNERNSFSFLSISYLQHGFECINDFLKRNPFRFPTSLSTLLGCMSSEDSFLEEHLDKLKNRFQNIHQKIIKQDLNLVEIQSLSTHPHFIQNLKDLLTQLQLPTQGLDMDLITRFNSAFDSAKSRGLELKNVLNFLKEKKLCYVIEKEGLIDMYELGQTDLEKINENYVTLKNYLETNTSLHSRLNLDPEVFVALATFHNSGLFSERFGECPKSYDFSVGFNQIIKQHTKTALKQLESLINNESMKLRDLTNTFTGQLADLKGQARRQRKLEFEFETISDYFRNRANQNNVGGSRIGGGGGGTVLSQHLLRFEAALYLLKLKERLPAFLSAIHGLNFDSILSSSLTDTFQRINSDLDDFTLAEAVQQKGRLETQLQGLDFFDLNIISKLASKTELSVDRILKFFQRNNSVEMLDQALTRAAGNPHVSGVLGQVGHLRELLIPFWAPIPHTSLRVISSHFHRVRRMSPDNTACVSLDLLSNVIENWAECETYFRDRKTENIFELIRKYQASGRFVSSLRSHAGGEFLSFYYTASGETYRKITLSPEQLQEHVQWAVLGATDKQHSPTDGSQSDTSRALKDFVDAFDLAQRVHQKRLECEVAGHPDFQSQSGQEISPFGCGLQHIQEAMDDVTAHFENWKIRTSEAILDCPRLQLLTQQGLVNFLLLFRCSDLPLDIIVLRAIPYVVQCFPSLIGDRKYLITLLTEFIPQVFMSDIAYQNLDSAVQLFRLIQEYLDSQGLGSHTTISEEDSEITRVELNSPNLILRYRYHMQSTIANLGFPVIPAMVLWGDSHVSMNQIHSFIKVSRSGLVPLMQVVGVDRLSSRIRDELLRFFQQSLPRCPVQLIFGEQEGLDTFSQYKCDPFTEVELTRIQPQSLWPCSANIPDTTERGNSRVSVVCGGPGVGKSRWIMEDASRQGTPDRTRVLKFVVHEGFSVSSVIKKIETSLFVVDYLEIDADEFEFQLSPRPTSSSPRNESEPEIINYIALENPILVLIFDVTIFADLSPFSRFLHHLLALGLVYDEESGASFALFPGTNLRVYLEFPAISIDDTTIWPNNGTDWTPRQHPFSSQLPILALMKVEYKKIHSRSFPLILDENSRFLAVIVQVYNRNELDSDEPLPTTPLSNIDDETTLVTLTEFFSRNGFQPIYALLNQAILLLSERLKYLARIKAAYLAECEQRCQHDITAFFQQFRGKFKIIFELMVRECRDISSNNANLPPVSIYSIRPNSSENSDAPFESTFSFFVITNDSNHPDFLVIQKKLQNMTVYVMDISKKVNMAKLRSAVAPIFGMLNTSYMGQNLLDAGHLLTPESLIRLLHMHARRSVGANVIYEGETGCGKSQNLKCYSYLINADSFYFANLKLHLLAILIQAVQFIQSQPEVDTEDRDIGQDIIERFNEMTLRILHMTPLSTKEELIDGTEQWLKLGYRNLPNEFGLFLCMFALTFLLNFPLYGRNLSPFVRTKLQQFRDWAALQRIDTLTKYHTEVNHAFNSTCLAAEKYCPPIPVECFIDEKAFDSIGEASPFPERLFPEVEDLMTFLREFVSIQPACLYHRILADEGLTPQKWKSFISKVKSSVDIHDSSKVPPTVCVFVDELNTAGCLGMVSEVFSSQTLNGVPLPPWLFFVGAVNPHRKSSEAQARAAMDFTKSTISSKLLNSQPEDESKDYLAGVPYIVKRLPVNLSLSTVHYPNLSVKSEVEFLREYMSQHLKVLASADYQETCMKMILKAQSLVREFNIPRVFMSIRNLIRATQLLIWLIKFQVRISDSQDLFANIFLPDHSLIDDDEDEKYPIILRHALIMSITITYMFQLPSKGHVQIHMASKDFREDFQRKIIHSWTISPGMNFQEWSHVVSESLEHLWKYAQIPPGLAKTRALMENLYSIIIAGENKIPLLITGPPGCGKTLAFNLACDNLKGPCPNHSVPFQNLKKVTKLMYQCSVTSTGPEIASRFSEAHSLQEEKERQQSGKHLIHVGIDEAGLTPENRQALKALHDHLDMRTIGTTMMSNTTLDAAKTSRMIQLLQTQVNMEDLNALAFGLLLPEENLSKLKESSWNPQVRGLCEAYYHIKDAVPKDCWFHSRDFVYLCRMLHRVSTKSAQAKTLFTSKTLLSCLRRHFQTLDPNQFPQLALHFLTRCDLSLNDDQDPNASEDESSTVRLSLEPQVVDSLRDSLKDVLDDHTDPTSAHCRYTMVVDPTDSETAVDLLFALKLLDQDNTEVVSLSDFPEDSTPTRRTQTLAKVKKAIEEGKCLLLLNSSPLQSALYDVINRHYSINIFEDERGNAIKKPFANISLGSFSQMVEVHPNFRLVIHVPESQLPVTPMPFLNRMEKFKLSVRDSFDQRVLTVSLSPPPCLRSLETEELRHRLFRTLQQGMEHFVEFSGGFSSFYGLSISETIPALLLRMIEDSTHSSSSQLELRSSILLTAKKILQNFEAKIPQEEIPTIVEDESKDLATIFSFNHSDSSLPPHHQLRILLRSLNFQLLESARAESVFRLRSKLPQAYVRTYVDHQEHFSVMNLVRTLMASRLASSILNSRVTVSEKLVVYTRSSDDLVRLMSPIHASEYFNLQPRFENYNIQVMNENNITFEDSDHPTLCILHLSQFHGSIACEKAMQFALRTSRDSCRILLLVANMKSCTTNQVAFARHVVDQSLIKEHENFSQPQVIFLLHVPSKEVKFRSCYQTIPLNRWTSMYIDNFSDGSFLKVNLDQDNNDDREEYNGPQHVNQPYAVYNARSSHFQWLRVAFALQDTPQVQDVRAEFSHLIDQAFQKAVNSCNFQQQIRPAIARHPKLFFEKVGITQSLALQAYQNGAKQSVLELIQTRRYLIETIQDSFTDLWGRVLSATVSDACTRLERGSTARGLIARVRSSHNLMLSDFMKLIIRQELAADWNLESLSRLPNGLNEGPLQQYSLHSQPSSWPELVQSPPEIVRAFLSISLLKLLISLHGTSDHAIGSSNYLNNRVNCSNTNIAARLPFFNSFLRYLDCMIPSSKDQLNKAHRSTTQDAPPQPTLDASTFRNLINQSPLHVLLSQTIFFIEHCPPIWTDFKHDLICSRLGYCSHPPQEQTVLIHIAERHFEQTSEQPLRDLDEDPRQSSNDAYTWVLSQQRIDSLLFPISKLMVQLRGFFSEDEFQQIYSLPPTSDPHSHLLSLAIQKLWEAFISFTSQTTRPTGTISWENWICCMREISYLEVFSSSRTMLNFQQSQTRFTHDNHENTLIQFASMMSLFHIVAFMPTTFIPSSLQFTSYNRTKLCFSTGIEMSDDNFLLNHLQLLQRIHLVVDGFHINRGLIDSLFWLATWLEPGELIRSLPTFNVLVAGLLGFSELPPEDQTRLSFPSKGLLRLFQNLHFESRLELLRLLYRKQPQVLEEFIDHLLMQMIREDQRDRLTTDVMYFPKELMSLMTPFATATLFPTLNLKNFAKDSSNLEFIEPRGDLAAMIVYQLLQISQENTSNLQTLCLDFNRLSQASIFHDSTPVLTQLRKTSCLSQIFELAAMKLSEELKKGRQLNLLETFNHQIIKSLQGGLSKAPRLLSLYLLSCFPDFSSITLLLKDSIALQSLGIGFWFDPPISQEGNLNEREILKRKAALELSQIKLTAIHYSSHLARYHSRVLLPRSPPLQSLLSAPVPEDKLTSDCASFVKLLMSGERPQQLSMNVHIPNIVAIVSFLRSKLEHKLTNIEQARTMFIEDALSRLPASEEKEGLNLFKSFLQSWAILRVNFQTFVICARELTQAAEIPPLTDKFGERPCCVSDLLEMPDAVELESFPARILTKRLLKHTSEVLSNPELDSLRGNHAFNPLQCLATNRVEKVELSRISSQLTQQSTTSALFTGPFSNEDRIQISQSVLLAHSHWVNGRPPLQVPPTLDNQVRMIDYKEVIRQRKEAAAREAQQLAHDLNHVQCPHCHMCSEKASGCEHMTCGNPGDAYGWRDQGRTVREGFGCGREINFHRDRVKAPVVGQPVDPVFLNAQDNLLPASMLQMELPRLPALPPFSGHYEVDWIAIAKYLTSTFVNGKIEIEFESDSFFSRLPFLSDLSKSSQGNSVIPIDNDLSRSRLLENSDQSFSGLFARVNVAAVRLQERLVQLGELAVPLEGESLDELMTFISSQQEQQQDRICNQCLDLILEAIQYIESKINSDNQRIPHTSLTLTPLAELMQREPHSWESSFKNFFRPFSIRHLPELSHQITLHASEGGKTYPDSLNVQLPIKNQFNLKLLRTKIMTDLFTNPTTSRIESFEFDLQHFASFLSDSEDLFLREKDSSTQIRELEQIKIYFERLNANGSSSNPTSSFQSLNLQIFQQILQTGDIRIKHFGELMKLIRYLLGKISYQKLSSFSALTTQSEPTEGIQEQACPNPLNSEDIDPFIYKELIPSEWESLQETRERLRQSQTDGFFQPKEYEKQQTPIPSSLHDETTSQIELELTYSATQLQNSRRQRNNSALVNLIISDPEPTPPNNPKSVVSLSSNQIPAHLRSFFPTLFASLDSSIEPDNDRNETPQHLELDDPKVGSQAALDSVPSTSDQTESSLDLKRAWALIDDISSSPSSSLKSFLHLEGIIDEDSLSLSPELWPTILSHIGSSDYSERISVCLGLSKNQSEDAKLPKENLDAAWSILRCHTDSLTSFPDLVQHLHHSDQNSQGYLLSIHSEWEAIAQALKPFPCEKIQCLFQFKPFPPFHSWNAQDTDSNQIDAELQQLHTLSLNLSSEILRQWVPIYPPLMDLCRQIGFCFSPSHSISLSPLDSRDVPELKEENFDSPPILILDPEDLLFVMDLFVPMCDVFGEKIIPKRQLSILFNQLLNNTLIVINQSNPSCSLHGQSLIDLPPDSSPDSLSRDLSARLTAYRERLDLGLIPISKNVKVLKQSWIQIRKYSIQFEHNNPLDLLQRPPYPLAFESLWNFGFFPNSEHEKDQIFQQILNSNTESSPQDNEILNRFYFLTEEEFILHFQPPRTATAKVFRKTLRL